MSWKATSSCCAEASICSRVMYCSFDILIETVVSSKKFNFLYFLLLIRSAPGIGTHSEKSGRERVALVLPGPLASEDTERCSWSTFVHRDDLTLWSEPASRNTQR